MSVIDYTKKAIVIRSGLPKLVKKLDRKIYQLYEQEKYQDVAFEEMMFCIDNKCSMDDLAEARKINSATYKRITRLKERIQAYLEKGQCIWLTLTFTDEILSKTTEETRRRYVSRYLKSQSDYYIANIDFGKTTEREHYHAVVCCDYVSLPSWCYGFAYTERIKNHVKASIKLSKYVSKLTNHAIKETTKRQVYIYSRCM